MRSYTQFLEEQNAQLRADLKALLKWQHEPFSAVKMHDVPGEIPMPQEEDLVTHLGEVANLRVARTPDQRMMSVSVFVRTTDSETGGCAYRYLLNLHDSHAIGVPRQHAVEMMVRMHESLILHLADKYLVLSGFRVEDRLRDRRAPRGTI